MTRRSRIGAVSLHDRRQQPWRATVDSIASRSRIGESASSRRVVIGMRNQTPVDAA